MAKPIIEVVSDVPFSVPSEVGVIVDLPAKKFTANPFVTLGIVTAVVGVGVAVVVYKHKAKKKAELAEAAEELAANAREEALEELDDQEVSLNTKTPTPKVMAKKTVTSEGI